MRRSLITATLALSAALSVVALTGCSISGASSPDSMPAVGAPESAPQGDLGYESAAGGAVGDDGVSTPSGPRIITTVQVTVTVDKPIDAADEAARIVDRAGGTVANRSERAASENEPGSAQLTLRIPSAKLTATLEELKDLGVARDTSINSTDVTAQSEDLDARIAALRTSVDRLLDLMAKADSTDALIKIESALSERQANLESLESQKRNLDDQVQLSTVTLYLISEKDTPAETPDTFWTGLVAGWTAFVGFVSAALVVLGVLVPWLIAAGIVTAIVLLWVRLARRRKAAPTE
ncbi:MAG TPA: DUF4349 domain-containing protein [Terrimesophilobacter sp.]|nr:DUF4349 domain-containing protein [Terrimesophilobacter sp.]